MCADPIHTRDRRLLKAAHRAKTLPARVRRNLLDLCRAIESASDLTGSRRDARLVERTLRSV